MFDALHPRLALALIFVAVLAACSPTPTLPSLPSATPTLTSTPRPTATPTATATPAPPASQHPGRLVYLTAHEPDTLDPQVDYTEAGTGVLLNVYETLVTYDRSNPAKFAPLLAESIPVPVTAEDGSVSYTFVIPSNIEFHDGAELTAADVAYSLWRALLLARSDRDNPLAGTGARTPGFLLLDAFFGVDDAAWLVDASGKFVNNAELLRTAAPDKLQAACEQVKAAITFDTARRTITLKLSRPYAPLLAALAGPWSAVLSKDWMAAQGEWDGDCHTWQYFYGVPPDSGLIREQANGTGPYRLDHWTPGSELVLTANLNYRNGAPQIKRVEIKPIAAFDQRLAELRTGTADLIEATTPAEQAQLERLVRERCDLQGHCDLIDFNGRLRVYDDLPTITRRAVFFNFALSKNSPYLGSGALDGQGVPPDFFADVHVRRAFDACFDRGAFITATLNGQGAVPLALTLPDQPGYGGEPGKFDPVQCEAEFKAAHFKTKDDQTLWDTGFALELPYRDGDEAQQAVLDHLAQQVRQVNARFVITPVAVSALDWQRELDGRQIPLAALGWQEDIPDPHNWYSPYLLATYTTRFNLPADLAQKYQALIDQGAATLDQAARASAYASLNAALHDDALLILLPYTTTRRYEPVYLAGWLNGLSMNPLVPDPGYVYDYNTR